MPSSPSGTAPGVRITTDFPGGNGLIERIEGDTVHLRPDLRDTAGHWFYWSIRVRGAAGRTLRFLFPDEACLTARGPALSTDGGATWRWLPESLLPDAEGFAHTFGPADDDVRLALGLPYQLADWEAFARRLPAAFRLAVFTQTRGGRPVPMTATSPAAVDTPVIILTARAHACEAAANYVLEGALAAWPVADGPPIEAIPFLDLDGVEAGDQGKNRQPHDHNRDYTGESLYPEPRALRERVGALPGPFIVLDLHCPWVRGAGNELVYVVGSQVERMRPPQDDFVRLLETHAAGLPFAAANLLAFGTEWNVAATFGDGKGLTTWAGEQPHCLLAATLEIPYAVAEGVEVTPERARTFGAAVGAAVRDFANR